MLKSRTKTANLNGNRIKSWWKKSHDGKYIFIFEDSRGICVLALCLPGGIDLTESEERVVGVVRRSIGMYMEHKDGRKEEQGQEVDVVVVTVE